MTDQEKREAAREFYNKWHARGTEGEDTRSYLFDTLEMIPDVSNVTNHDFAIHSVAKITLWIAKSQMTKAIEDVGLILQKKAFTQISKITIFKQFQRDAVECLPRREPATAVTRSLVSSSIPCIHERSDISSSQNSVFSNV